MDDNETTTSPMTLAIAWLIVAIPLGWGVYKSVVNSLPLFATSATPAAADAPRNFAPPAVPSSEPPPPATR